MERGGDLLVRGDGLGGFVCKGEMGGFIIGWDLFF